MKLFTYAVVIIVAAAIVTGFFVVGLPKEQRLRRFDEQRIMDLQNIQSRISDYWTNNNKLPDKLELLNDDISGFRVPRDPETQKEYEYEVKGPVTFILCTDFNRPSFDKETNTPKPLRPEGAVFEQEIWMHGEGHVCFDRTINTNFNKPRPKV